MNKIKCLLILIVSVFLVGGCACAEEDDSKIEYTHYLRGGGKEKLKADILMEYSNSVYTKYQVAYTSYVCSDPSVNYTNVIYIEITNKDKKSDALIRNISFSTIEDANTIFDVGLWGDYKVAFGDEYYTGIENELLPKLKYAKYDFISSLADEGYGNYKSIDGLNADAIASGTISASNIVSIVKAIFDYHIENYY
jgi:hypothetical protein